MVGLCLVALFAFAGAASASTLARNGNSLTYNAAPGDPNDVVVDYTDADTFSMSDLGVAAIDVSVSSTTETCTQDVVEPNTVTCTGTILKLTANLGDQQDFFDASALTNLPLTVNGESGFDSITTGDSNDTIDGGADDDTLDGGAGNDTLSGGDGLDELTGGIGNDTLGGGNDGDFMFGDDGGDTLNGDDGDDEIDPGTHYIGGITPGSDGADTINGGAGDADTVDYSGRTAPLTIDLSGGGDGSGATTGNGQSGENDSLRNVEDANVGVGADTVTGNSKSNMIMDFGGPGDVINTLAGDDEIEIRDDQVDSADCGDGNDLIYADVAGQFGSTVSDSITGCEAVNSDYTPPPPVDNTPPPSNNTAPPLPVTNTPPVNNTPPPIKYTLGAFVSSLQQSPKANKVVGSATIATDGATLLVQVFNGKPSKKTLVGKTSKKGLKKGNVPFTVNLSKKASKAALKKKKGVKMTVKVTITPATGKAFVKTFKVTVKKGKANACFRVARERAQAAC